METQFTVDPGDEGERLDAYLAARLTQYSRVTLRKQIQAGAVKVDGARAKPAYRLKAGQVIVAEPGELPVEGPRAEDIPLDILYEDDDLVAVNKPAGMVVHPAKGHWSGTLASALAFHFQNLSSVGGPTRPGIVHRLDRETSGVIVIAKTNAAHMALAAQFENRTTEKEYFAIVTGVPNRDRDVIRQPIGVHPYQREKMAIRAGHETSRDAETYFEVVDRAERFAILKVQPKTGRTHQIRVHLAHAGHPVLCDRLYSGRSEITVGELRQVELPESDVGQVVLARVALHARRLKLAHPSSGEPIEFTAPLPDDLEATKRLAFGK